MSIYVLNLSSHAHVSTAGQVHAFHLSFKIFFLSLFCFFFLLPSSTKKNRAKHGSAPSLSHLGNKVWVKKCVFSITLYFFFLYIHGSHKYLYVHLKSNNLLDQKAYSHSSETKLRGIQTLERIFFPSLNHALRSDIVLFPVFTH